jgi:hypothetical protein
VREHLARLKLQPKDGGGQFILVVQLRRAISNDSIDTHPLRLCEGALLMLEAGHIQQLIDESVQSIDVLYHGFVKLLPLRSVYGSSVERLQI